MKSGLRYWLQWVCDPGVAWGWSLHATLTVGICERYHFGETIPCFRGRFYRFYLELDEDCSIRRFLVLRQRDDFDETSKERVVQHMKTLAAAESVLEVRAVAGWSGGGGATPFRRRDLQSL